MSSKLIAAPAVASSKAVKCTICPKNAITQCGNCLSSPYCSVKCQKQDFAIHATQCKLVKKYNQKYIGVGPNDTTAVDAGDIKLDDDAMKTDQTAQDAALPAKEPMTSTDSASSSASDSSATKKRKNENNDDDDNDDEEETTQEEDASLDASEDEGNDNEDDDNDVDDKQSSSNDGSSSAGNAGSDDSAKAPAVAGEEKKKKVKRSVDPSITGIFFGDKVKFSPVKVGKSTDVKRFQFLAPEWPNVENPADVLKKFHLDTWLSPVSTLKSVLHHFYKEKFIHLGDPEYAEMLFESAEVDLQEKANMDYYAQNRVDREAAREIPRIVSLTAQKKALKVMLNTNWSKSNQLEAMRKAVKSVFDKPSSKISKALMSTGNQNLYLYSSTMSTSKYDAKLFAFNPYTKEGDNWYGRLLMDRRAVLAEIYQKTQDIDLPYLLASTITYPFESSPVNVLAARNSKLVDGPALMAFWSSVQDDLPAGAPEDTPRETRPVVYTELLPEGQSLTIEQFAAKAETIWNTVFKGPPNNSTSDAAISMVDLISTFNVPQSQKKNPFRVALYDAIKASAGDNNKLPNIKRLIVSYRNRVR